MGLKKNSGPAKRVLTDDEIAEGNCALLARHMVQIMEESDLETIQIIATRTNADGQPQRFNYGKGNAYARIQSLQLWLRDVYQNDSL